MASTYSTLKFELIGTGEQSGTWGNTTNTNLGTAIQEAITGSADVTFASGTVTLTLTDTNATQTARNLRLNLTGTSGGAQNLIVPAIEKFYLVNNGVADAITVKNSTGTGIAVPAGKAMLVFNDGTNVVDAVTHMSSLTLTTALAVAQGGTGATTASGARTNLGLGTIATQAASAVAITGGSITGITDLTVADGGTGASTAANARTNLGLVIGTDVPGPTGTGASGTWGISITGNAVTATSATSATSLVNSGSWSVAVSGLNLIFSYNGTDKGKLDTSGNFTVIGNVVAGGTI
jgi:hypothetical protein